MLASLRLRLRVVVAAWLVCHVAAGILIGSRATLPDDCTCPAGMTPGQTCPMHHSPASTARCRLVNAQDNSSMFSSIFAVAGVLPERTLCADALLPLSFVSPASFRLIRHTDTPHAPPPRV